MPQKCLAFIIDTCAVIDILTDWDNINRDVQNLLDPCDYLSCHYRAPDFAQ